MLLPHNVLGWALIEVLPRGTVTKYHELLHSVQSYRADKALSMDKLWRCLSLYMDYCATQATASAECVEPAAVDQAADESAEASIAVDQAADESADAAAESAEQDKPDAKQPAAEADDAAAEEVASAEAGDAVISEGAESAEAEAGLTADAAAEEVAPAGTDTQQVDSSVNVCQCVALIPMTHSYICHNCATAFQSTCLKRQAVHRDDS